MNQGLWLLLWSLHIPHVTDLYCMCYNNVMHHSSPCFTTQELKDLHDLHWPVCSSFVPSPNLPLCSDHAFKLCFHHTLAFLYVLLHICVGLNNMLALFVFEFIVLYVVSWDLFFWLNFMSLRFISNIMVIVTSCSLLYNIQ